MSMVSAKPSALASTKLPKSSGTLSPLASMPFDGVSLDPPHAQTSEAANREDKTIGRGQSAMIFTVAQM
jgi:hypothetical protein